MKLIKQILLESKNINVSHLEGDGRIESSIGEIEFLTQLKNNLLIKHPKLNIIICSPRSNCDIIINNLRINLKITQCKKSDNSMNKSAIYYSITGDSNYPYSSNWNEFLEKLLQSQHLIKTKRDRMTEYHYLVKNKITGDVMLKSIFDIQTYISNPSNDLQINWKKEFENINYFTKDEEYNDKVRSLLICIQKSVREMIDRSIKFAEADLTFIR